MRRLILLLTLAAAPALAADRIAKEGDNEVRLTESPCTVASVLRHIPEELRMHYQRADGRMGGQRYFACWREGGGMVHLWWEDGDQGFIPVRALRDVPST